MDCLITWGAAATDGGCRLVAAATVWRVAGRFPLVGRSVVRLCSLALVVRVLFAACVLAWLAAYGWRSVVCAPCLLFMSVLPFCGVFYFVCPCSFC